VAIFAALLTIVLAKSAEERGTRNLAALALR
jgi:hypothetical protein